MKNCTSCGRDVPPGQVCPRCLLGFVNQPDEGIPEPDFINVAIQKKLVTFEQIQSCMKEGRDVPVWEVLIERGHLTREQAQAILSGREPAKSFMFGPYSILKKIGEGGMGTVYKAMRRDNSIVALKVLPDRFSKSEHVKRFEREAKIAIQLSHPNIVKGYEHGQINNRWYYAMEFIQGQTLAQLIAKRKRLDLKAALQIAVQMTEALEAIYRAGLVHRDLKPENIIVGEDGVAKLMDLGLVKSTVEDQTALTQSGHAVGTLHYMSPEQAQGADVDIRSDIFSLGASIYHMVTGQKPFGDQPTPLAVLRAQMTHKFEDPRKYQVDDNLSRLIESMMARERELRPQTPAAVLSDLRRIRGGGAPVHEAPRRRPVWMIWAGAATLAAAGVVAFVATRPSAPVSIPKQVVEKKENVAERIEMLLEGGRLMDASALLEKEAGRLSGEKALSLRKRLEEQVEQAWSRIKAEAATRVAAKDFNGARKVVSEAVLVSEDKRMAVRKEIDAAEQIKPEDPRGDAEARFRMLEDSIKGLEAAGEYQRAIGILEGARAMASDNAIFAEMIDARIIRLREIAKAKKPEPPAPPPPVKDSTDALWKRANSEFISKKYDVAIVTLAGMKEARAYGLRSHCFFRLGNRENAEQEAKRAVELDAADGNANLVLGLLAVDKGSWSDAVSALSRAISADPTRPELYVARARAWVELVGWTEALSNLDEAVRRLSELGDSLEVIALRTRALEGSGKPAEAIDECGRWIKAQPKSVEPLLKRAGLYLQVKKTKEARDDFAAALKIDPKNAAALKGKEEADVALKPKEETKPMTAAQLRKKVAEHLNATTETLNTVRDGKISARLVYDMSDAGDAKDFMFSNAKVDAQGALIDGDEKKLGVIVLKPRWTGDFYAKIDFALLGKAEDAKDLGIRTAGSGDPAATDTPGVGVGVFQNPGWQMVLGVVGKSPLSPLKNVPLKMGAPASIVLKREGKKFSGWFGTTVSVEGDQEGSEEIYLRVYARASMRVTRIEIQGILDPEWVASVTGGKDELKMLAGTYEIEKDGKSVAVTVSVVEGALKIKVPEQPEPLGLTLVSKDRYSLDGAEGYFVEFTSEKGKVVSLTVVAPPGKPSTTLRRKE